MTDFAASVYHLAARIPPGKVATYGQLASLAGHPQASRVVGHLMKTNPFAPKVPCHRVVAANGHLTGFSAPGGLAAKRQLLISEGVIFKSLYQVDLSLCLVDQL